MALPKLETKTYTLTLPSTGEEIKYRPFLVKEQKILFKSLSRFNLFPLQIITQGEKYFFESYIFFIL